MKALRGFLKRDQPEPAPGQSDIRLQSAIEQIRPYFDVDFYRSHNADVVAAKVDALEHYLLHGWTEGRNPSASFDSQFYIETYFPEGVDVRCPLLDYALVGRSIGYATNRKQLAARRAQSDGVKTIGLLETLYDLPILRRPPLSSESARDILFHLFSPDYYKRQVGLDATLSDNEALLRYISFDLEKGTSPGPLFSAPHYLRYCENHGIHVGTTAPFLHWLDYGVRSKISPHPLYDDRTYIQLNSDLGPPNPWHGWPLMHLLEHGLDERRRVNPIIAVSESAARSSNKASAAPFMSMLSDVSDPDAIDEVTEFSKFRNSMLFKEIVDDAVALEPLIAPVKQFTPSHVPYFHDGPFLAFRSLVEAIPPGDYQTIILMPFCKLGGADFIAGCLTHAKSARSKVLVLRTEQSEWAYPQWFPDNIVSVDLSPHLKGLDAARRTKMLYELIRLLRPDEVFNVNSRACFDTFVRFGNRLRQFTRIYAYYFCADRTADGIETGYPVWYFSNIIQHLNAAIVDSAALGATLIHRFALPPELAARVRTAYTPAMVHARSKPVVEGQVRSRSGRSNPVLLWGGRMDRQKRFDLVIEIARRMPNVTFKCWGKAVLDSALDLKDPPSNLQIFPPFGSHDELPLEDCDGWLYTSQWDGLPTVLIECGALGMPIVASRVGGVGELIEESTGWPVENADDPAAYVEAITEMLADPQERIRRASALKAKVAKQHTMQAYGDVIARLRDIE